MMVKNRPQWNCYGCFNASFCCPDQKEDKKVEPIKTENKIKTFLKQKYSKPSKFIQICGLWGKQEVYRANQVTHSYC